MSKLQSAVWEKDQARVERALEDEDVNALTHGEGVLHTAVEKGWTQGIALLVERGADVNLKNERGDTPLIAAVVHKRPEAAKALIDAGADLEIANAIGSTPLNYVVRMNAGLEVTMTSWEVVEGRKIDVTVHDPDEPRGRAIAVARVLIEAGAEVDAEDGGGLTALGRAVTQSDPEFATLMLEAGADIDHRNGTNYTPLIAAASQNREESVAWLLAQGADPSAADDAGFSALHEAALGGNVVITKALLDAGADRTIEVKEGFDDIDAGMTARDIAEKRGHTDVVALYDA